MTCPACGTGGVSVIKTMDNGGTVSRRRLCACGSQWTTEEKVKAGTLVASNGHGVGTLVARSRGGDISLLPSEVSNPVLSDRAHAHSETRAKNPYSAEFEATWKLYGRKEEKVKAYAAWKIAAKREAGEDLLAAKVAGALAWQAPIWARDGWKFALYFERYIRRERWNDEPLPASAGGRAARSDGNVDLIGDWLKKGTG